MFSRNLTLFTHSSEGIVFQDEQPPITRLNAQGNIGDVSGLYSSSLGYS